MATESKTKKEGIHLGWMIASGVLGFFVILTIWWCVGHLPMWFAPTENPSLPGFGTYGDMFGFVNSLFSAIAFFAIVATLLVQMRELRYQRKDLELSWEELKKTTAAQQNAAESQRKAAEAQKEATEMQHQQVKATLLATYTQGVTALVQSPPVDELTIAQELSLRNLSGLTEYTARAISQTGKEVPPPPGSLDKLLEDRLEAILEITNSQIITSKFGTEASRAAHKQLSVLRDSFMDTSCEHAFFREAVARLERLAECIGTINREDEANEANRHIDRLLTEVRSHKPAKKED